MSVRVLQGNCVEVLRTLPTGSVNACITSPPYFGLRDYEIDPCWWGGDADCQHVQGDQDICVICGAWEGCLGMEKHPELFVLHLVLAFREVHRVLRPDGTLWLNIGDSYASDGGRGAGGNALRIGRQHQQRNVRPGYKYGDVKPKDLIGIPWMLAFALRADGWFLRQEIIWHKTNVTPGSAKDRCTTAHESLFLLAKRRHYYFDWEAIQEPASTKTHARRAKGELVPGGWQTGEGPHCPRALNVAAAHRKTRPKLAATPSNGTHRANPSFEAATSAEVLESRMKRSVWRLPSSPFTGPHFATFPPKLVEPCVLAGCPIDGTVLDPFFGAGTTGLVTERLHRHCIGIELGHNNVALARERIENDRLPLWPSPLVDHPTGGSPGTKGAKAP